LIDEITKQVVTLLEIWQTQSLTDAMHERIDRQLAWRNQIVMVQQGPHRITGRLRGIDARGRLRLRTETDERHLEAGEVHHCRTPSSESA